MAQTEKSIKAFTIPYEAWYKNVILGEPHIYVGMYYESGGCDGEVKIVSSNSQRSTCLCFLSAGIKDVCSNR